MRGRDSGIKPRVRVENADSGVKSRAAFLGSRYGFVRSAAFHAAHAALSVAVLIVNRHVGGVEPYTHHAQLDTGPEGSAKKVELHGILHAEIHVREEAYLVVYEHSAHSLLASEEFEGHVCAEVHGLRSVFEAAHLLAVSRFYDEAVGLSGVGGVVVAGDGPVLAELGVELCVSLCRRIQEQQSAEQPFAACRERSGKDFPEKRGGGCETSGVHFVYT